MTTAKSRVHLDSTALTGFLQIRASGRVNFKNKQKVIVTVVLKYCSVQDGLGTKKHVAHVNKGKD